MVKESLSALKITVITVCKNERNKIMQTVESVLAQTYSNIEYLVMDGASTDGTKDVLQKYAGYTNIHICSEPDFGIYNAMNRGIARATGQYVLFLNAGDVLYDEKVIADAVSYIRRDTEIIYYGKICLVQPDGSMQMEDFSGQKGPFEEHVFKGGMPCHQCIFAPRKLLADHYFRETYKIRADYEWLMYSIVHGAKCESIPVIVSYFDTMGVSSRFKNYMQREAESRMISMEYQGQTGQDTEVKLWDEDVRTWIRLSRKHLFLFQLVNYWIGLKQRNIDMGSYLRKKGYGHVAIYGLSHMGRTLLKELEGCNIKVEYGIDQNAEKICMDIPVYLPTDKLGRVDAIIVTAVMHFTEIKAGLAREIDCPVISIEDLLYEMAGLETTVV